jgi:hypothetical protein
MRIELRSAVLVVGCLGLIPSITFAEGREAQARVQQWKEAISSNPRLAVHFRSKRINTVFESVEERSGVFYRDEYGKVAFRLGECVDQPPSAVKDINSKWSRIHNPEDPGLVCVWDEFSVGMAIGKHSDIGRFRPPSALYPENSRTFAGWFCSQAPFGLLDDLFSPPLIFPLMFVESPEVGWYDAKLLQKAKSRDICLRLSLPPGTASNRTQFVDAVFRPGEKVPYAVRRFDPSETIETRFFIDSIQIGEDAEIPDDAFQLTTSN